MDKPTKKYWQKRFTSLTDSLLNKGENYYKELEEEYEKSLSTLQKDIEQFYIRFAENNEITMTDARRILDNRELKEFQWTVEEYIQKGKENAVDQRWMKELENASARVRLSILESLQYQVRQQVEIITVKRLHGLTKLSEELTKEGYYRSIYEVQKGFGIGDTFTILDNKTVESIISKPWAPDGSNFSERIWRDRELLVNELQKELAQSFIRGDAPDTAIRNISKKMNTSKKAAGRLIMTESAFFANEARAKAFKELGVEEFQFLATLDNDTSEICQEMDLRVFKLNEREIGVNWPPLHCWCRSTAVPYFEGNIKQRWARDPKTGKGYYVDGNMPYKEWYKEHVEGKYGKDEAEIIRKKKENEGTDLEQYKSYKKNLGDDLGVKSFEEFQNMKYNDSDGWNNIKQSYRENTSSKAWLKSEFPTEKSFNKHYDKHLNEFGNITKEEYLNRARELLSSSIKGGNVEGFKSEVGFVFRYNKETNDLAIGRPDGKISTLYKPVDGYKHYLEQIEKYNKK
ncbi:minor capsid protein [Tissierellaceae bacterium HCP3S3_D8]